MLGDVLFEIYTFYNFVVLCKKVPTCLGYKMGQSELLVLLLQTISR